jgi:uncharacterized cysteine cluster protein YcgN (CxxCxxCC family)|tara:strand:- start:1404 stop:1892 length:489 start_codon:yes stop_codon:yes gene_type:complete
VWHKTFIQTTFGRGYMTGKPFWETKTLEQLDDSEWESLCDGCGLCCLNKYEDPDTLEVEFTCVKCKHLNPERRCSVYNKRTIAVSGCLDIRDLPKTQYHWLPETCAYRRLSENRPLPQWHPLKAEGSQAMVKGGYCISEWAISDDEVDVDEDFIIKLKVSDS